MALTRRRIAVLLATAVVAGGGIASTASPASQSRPAAAAKTCSRGYKHAVIGGKQKCLRAGEFCTHRYDRQYRRYGYRCIRYDRKVQRYRLTRS
ncbi:MAG TPA: hypothetical protein VH297_11120 [Gaiellaceae bacterium]